MREVHYQFVVQRTKFIRYRIVLEGKWLLTDGLVEEEGFADVFDFWDGAF